MPYDGQARQLFELGALQSTPGALEALGRSKQSPIQFILRHVAGDWGCVCPDDANANLDALASGARIMSAYKTARGEKIWVITEADRSCTTVLTPEEY